MKQNNPAQYLMHLKLKFNVTSRNCLQFILTCAGNWFSKIPPTAQPQRIWPLGCE